MLKIAVLSAVLLAQAAIPMPPPAGVQMMSPARAGEVSGGITVSGAGYASGPAGVALVTLRISTRNNTLTLNAQTLGPIADALVRAGFDRNSIVLPPYLVGEAHTNNAAITAAVHHPTLAMLQQGMLTLASTFAANPGILLNDAEVRLSADDCTQLQQTAQANAIANARRNAEFIAKRISVRVGGVLAVDDRGTPIGAEGACMRAYSISPYGGPYPQETPAQMLTVKVYSGITMRFAIQR